MTELGARNFFRVTASLMDLWGCQTTMGVLFKGPTDNLTYKQTSWCLKKTNKVSFKKLQNGKIVKNVDEQYIRSDLPCGLKGCPVC